MIEKPGKYFDEMYSLFVDIRAKNDNISMNFVNETSDSFIKQSMPVQIWLRWIGIFGERRIDILTQGVLSWDFQRTEELTRPYDDDDEEFEDFKPKAYEEIPITPKTPAQARSSYGGFEERRDSNRLSTSTPARSSRSGLPNGLKICGDCRSSEEKRRLTNLDEQIRILRAGSSIFSAALYAQEKIKKVAVSTYIITPYNVDLLGDLIDELENNGLYF